MHRIIRSCLSAIFCLLPLVSQAEEPLTVHEWGTFTSVQNAKGETLHGYFINNEPVPFFVHGVNYPGRHFNGIRSEEEAKSQVKGGVPAQHPDLIMRLETPVLYFYPPTGAKLPLTLDVKAGMRGGWLTEHYPKAQSNITDQDVALDKPLKTDFVGTLKWQALQVSGVGKVPETQDKVWLAPRQTKSAFVHMAAANETEHYLFYRGVANVRSPLRVTWQGDSLEVGGDEASLQGVTAKNLPVTDIWLVEVNASGDLAYRTVPALADAMHLKTMVTASASFAPADFGAAARDSLRQLMRAAIIRHGMFADEAEAMLATWEKSYFSTSGRRVFYLVPRAWVEHYLPLQFSAPVKLERAFVGRIELR